MSERLRRLSELLLRYGAWVCLLPTPLWLLFHLAIQPQPAWLAQYVPADPNAPSVTRFEKALSHYWTSAATSKEVIELPPVEPAQLKATFDTCLSIEHAAEVPLMLVASGTARLLLDGQVVLEITKGDEHVTHGKRHTFEPGSHHLRIEFAARTKPVIGLLASFDDAPPKPVGSGVLAPGIATRRPSDGPTVACAGQ